MPCAVVDIHRHGIFHFQPTAAQRKVDFRILGTAEVNVQIGHGFGAASILRTVNGQHAVAFEGRQVPHSLVDHKLCFSAVCTKNIILEGRAGFQVVAERQRIRHHIYRPADQIIGG